MTVQAGLEPVDDETLAVALAKMMDYFNAFDIGKLSQKPQAQVDEISNAYWAVMCRLPADLVWQAVNRIKADYRWGNALPKPKEVVELVEDEWSRRTTAKARMDAAIQYGRNRDDRPKRYSQLSPEQQAEFDAMMAKTKAALHP